MRFQKTALLAVALACAGAADAETVKIGAVYALTGPGAVGGGDGMRGTELAVDEVNASGGLKRHAGTTVELVKGDTQSKPINAVGETERLITQDKVALVMGAATSNETLPMSQVAEKYGVPHVNTIPQSAALTSGKLKWTWSTTVIDGDYVKGILGALDMIRKAAPDLKKVAVLAPDNEYGIEMAKLLKEALASRKDITLTAFIEYSAAAQDLLQPALKLKASRPDIVVQVGYFRSGVLASKAYQQLDFHPIVVGTGGMSGDPKLRAEIGKLVEGQFAVTPFAGDLPGAAAVADAYRKKFGQPLTLNSALGYFGARVALKALDEAKTFSPQDVADALQKVKVDKSHMITASDFIAFDRNGRNEGRATVVTQFQGEKLVTVWPDGKAKANPDIVRFNSAKP